MKNVMALFALAALNVEALPLRTVVVTVTKGFRHESIPTAERVLREMAAASGTMRVVFAREDGDLDVLLSPAALERTDLVIFANTTGEIPLPDRAAFVEWVRSGGAFIGIHSAADTLHDFDPYLDVIGGEFDFHGGIVAADVFVESSAHPATSALAPVFTARDEYYRFKRFDPSAVEILLALHSDPDRKTPAFLPLTWARNFGRGKVFYTAFGHTRQMWETPWFQQHLAGAILSMIPEDERPRRRRAVRP